MQRKYWGCFTGRFFGFFEGFFDQGGAFNKGCCVAINLGVFN
jgi:hypothetical protein